ncbi:zinc finger and BTB domain-containing protein 5 [Grus japonensis]|uniref:Zinc finger and BTB domain-containing protein 5 n=1 Tax=Grus japonensis TaxID=30415 RepID=A0ABC9WIF5_GRUJA
MVKTMVRQAVPLQSMEDDGAADNHLQPIEDPTLEEVEAPEGGCGAVGSLSWRAGTWQDLWPHGERSPGWSRFAGRTCDPMGDPRWSSLVLKVCTPWRGPTLE